MKVHIHIKTNSHLHAYIISLIRLTLKRNQRNRFFLKSKSDFLFAHLFHIIMGFLPISYYHGPLIYFISSLASYLFHIIMGFSSISYHHGLLNYFISSWASFPDEKNRYSQLKEQEKITFKLEDLFFRGKSKTWRAILSNNKTKKELFSYTKARNDVISTPR